MALAFQNTVTDTMPAAGSGPSDGAAPTGPAPQNPFQRRERRPRGGQGPMNPFAPQAGGMGAPAPAPGVNGGPNPQAMNQAGLAPQAAGGVTATPNAAITSTTPASSLATLAGQPPASAATRNWVPQYTQNNTDTASRLARVNPGINGGDPLQNPNFKQWQNLMPRADAAAAAVTPYQETALNRLGSMYNNPTVPGMRGFADIAPGSGANYGGGSLADRTAKAASDADLAAGSLKNGAPVADDAMSLADRVSGRYGDGYTPFERVNTDLTAGGLITPEDTARQQNYSNVLDNSVSELGSGPSRSQLATDYVGKLNAADDIGLDKQLKTIREQQAADGRLGLAADTQVNDLLSRVAAERASRNAGLALSAAEGDVGDRYNTIGSLKGLVGQQEDIASGRRGELRGERGYTTGIQDTNIGRAVDERNAGFAAGQANSDAAFARQRTAVDQGRGLAGDNLDQTTGRLSALAGREGQLQGLGADLRGEARTERGAGLSYDQQQQASALGLSAQQFQQMLDLAKFGDPNRTLDPYTTMAGIESGATNINLSGRYKD